MAKESGKGLYKKRYATLKEHRAAVAASKTNKGGKNVGPVAHGQSYANSLKVKPAEKKPAPAPKASKPAPKPAPKATPKPTGDGSVKAIPVKRTGSTEVKKTEPKKVAVKPKRHRGGSRANNNTRGLTQTASGPKAGATRRIRKGSKYVTQMWNGSKWVTGNLGSNGAKG